MKQKTDWKMKMIMDLLKEQRMCIALLGASLFVNIGLLMEMVL
tara:strand:- start:246 stop:374 length:129 start_codon:yes stop_codon:yes gene_type:complete